MTNRFGLLRFGVAESRNDGVGRFVQKNNRSSCGVAFVVFAKF